MMKNHPNFHFPIATASPPIQLPDRNRCCATLRCNLCPVDAKFTAFNEFRNLISSKNIDFYLGLEAREIICQAGVASGVLAKSNDGLFKKISGDLIVLGAYGIQSPVILLRSNILHPKTGVGVCEQLGYEFEIKLDGRDNFDGGTITTELNYSPYNDGIDRSKHGASLLYVENRIKYGLRTEHKRWRQNSPLVATIEDMYWSNSKYSIKLDFNCYYQNM